MEVFVYGTLADRSRAGSLLETFEYGPDAVLEGLRRVEGTYPTLAPGGRVEGRLLRTPAVETLDRYEGVDRGLYVRVAVPRRGTDGSVAVYVGDPAALDAPAEWPGEGPFAERVEAYVRERDVVVRRNT